VHIWSITRNKGKTDYRVAVRFPDGTIVRYFTYRPEEDRLLMPSIRFGTFYKPVLELAVMTKMALCNEIKQVLSTWAIEDVAEEGEEPETQVEKPKKTKEEPIPQAIEAPKRWDTLKRTNGTFWKRERIDDEKRGPMLEITEVEYMSLQSLDAPLEPPT
jgi:hypothetical protein